MLRLPYLKLLTVLVSLTVSIPAQAQYESCEVISEEAWEGDSAAVSQFVMSCGIIDTVIFNSDDQLITEPETEPEKKAYQTVTMKLNSGKVLFRDSIYFVVKTMPLFPGGQEGLVKYLGAELKYPVNARNKKKSGTVYVNFIINKQGKVTKPVVTRSVYPDLDKEALRVVKGMPDWTPGVHKGNPVSVQLTVPVKFSLR